MQSSRFDKNVYDEIHMGMTLLSGPWRSSGAALRMAESELPKPEDKMKKMFGI